MGTLLTCRKHPVFAQKYRLSFFQPSDIRTMNILLQIFYCHGIEGLFIQKTCNRKHCHLKIIKVFIVQFILKVIFLYQYIVVCLLTLKKNLKSTKKINELKLKLHNFVIKYCLMSFIFSGKVSENTKIVYEYIPNQDKSFIDQLFSSSNLGFSSEILKRS